MADKHFRAVSRAELRSTVTAILCVLDALGEAADLTGKGESFNSAMHELDVALQRLRDDPIDRRWYVFTQRQLYGPTSLENAARMFAATTRTWFGEGHGQAEAWVNVHSDGATFFGRTQEIQTGFEYLYTVTIGWAIHCPPFLGDPGDAARALQRKILEREQVMQDERDGGVL